jgi:hypothetical protein
MFEPIFLFNGDSHSSLAMAAHQNSEVTRHLLARIGSEFQVGSMLLTLDASRESGHWGIVEL